MEINVNNLKSEISVIDGLIEKYELAYLNFYNAINSESLVWKDSFANKFFSECEQEKVQINKVIDSLKNYVAIYKNLVSKYQDFGNHIQFKIEYRDTIYRYFNNCIARINNVIAMYEKIDVSSFPDLANKIFAEKNKLINVKSNIKNIKDKYSDYFSKIESIEKETGTKLNTINIGKTYISSKDTGQV